MERELQKVNQRSRLVVWGQRVEACRNSGQRVSKWCVKHGIPVSTYYNWQRKVFQAMSSENDVCFAEIPVRPLVYEELHRQLVKHEVLHADETTLQVLHEPGKKAQTKSYMWLYRTGREDGPPIVLYEYQPSRKAEHAEKFLEGFSGYLHADGYQGYHKLPGNIRVVGCWAHTRRKFDEVLNALPPDKREGTAALAGLEYCNKSFAWEERFKNLSPEERTKQRLKEETPILDALLAWADSVSAAPKSALARLYIISKSNGPISCGIWRMDGRVEPLLPENAPDNCRLR